MTGLKILAGGLQLFTNARQCTLKGDKILSLCTLEGYKVTGDIQKEFPVNDINSSVKTSSHC